MVKASRFSVCVSDISPNASPIVESVSKSENSSMSWTDKQLRRFRTEMNMLGWGALPAAPR